VARILATAKVIEGHTIPGCRMAMAMPEWSLTNAGAVGAENVHVDGALDELEPLELASWSSRR
jgi:hypothetical protein